MAENLALSIDSIWHPLLGNSGNSSPTRHEADDEGRVQGKREGEEERGGRSKDGEQRKAMEEKACAPLEAKREEGVKSLPFGA